MLPLFLAIVFVGALLAAVSAARRRLQNSDTGRSCFARIVCREVTCHSANGCQCHTHGRRH